MWLFKVDYETVNVGAKAEEVVGKSKKVIARDAEHAIAKVNKREVGRKYTWTDDEEKNQEKIAEVVVYGVNMVSEIDIK